VNWSLLLIGLAVFGAVSVAASYAIQVATADRTAMRTRLTPAGKLTPVGRPLLRSTGRSRFPLADILPISREARGRLQVELERAGQPLRVGEFLALRLGFAVVFALGAGMGMASAGDPPRWLVVASPLVGMLVGWAIPGSYLGWRQKSRQRKIEGQLAGALTSIVKSLRAGSGLLQALAYAGDQTPDPLGGELRSALRSLQLGAEAEQVFSDLGRRIGSRDMDIAITAILIQRSVGGNLSEILSNVVNTIRERNELAGEIRVLTSRQRLTSWMVAALPVIVAALFILLNPDIGTLLFSSTAGVITLIIAGGFEVLGIWIIRRLSVIEV